MPEISRFLGIIIRMYAEAGERHSRPHLHAYYQSEVAVYAIDSIERLGGRLAPRQTRLVEGWIELHREELLDNWYRLQRGRLPRKVDPLR